MREYYISTDKYLLNVERIQTLLSDCFWSKNIPINYVKKFIKHSLCFGAYKKDDDLLIGFGRVITDYTTFAYVCDIVIDYNYRKKGIGKKLISHIMSHPELRGLKTWSLTTTEDAKHIYEGHGFKIAENPNSKMEINDLNIYSK
ncbi:MAG: GNAT family N-acetyltransferase [Gammaproteobacteria bacterium]|nr:GNAT family N-acetyltransferase [Gammaproteobacteria bacterium]